jgi:CBS domain-containing protein
MSILVRHAMSVDVKTLGEDMNAADAAGVMANYDIGAVPVVGPDDDLLGLVTDRDIVVRVIAARRDPQSVRLGDIATKSVVDVSPDMRLSEARDLMAEHQIRRLPVSKDGRLVGILSLGDIALSAASKRAVGDALEDVSESERAGERERRGPARGTPDRVRSDTR